MEQTAAVVIPDSPLAKDYLAMPDVAFQWMQGGGEARPWLCPIYGMSAELEILDLLYSLVKLVRPKLIVETGCHKGIGTYALGKAAKEIGASVTTCDPDLECCFTTGQRCKGLPVWIVGCKAEKLPEIEKADFLFLDGSEDSRIQCVPRMKPGALAVMHDTRQEPFLRDAFTGYGTAIHLESWRGATIFVRNEQKRTVAATPRESFALSDPRKTSEWAADSTSG